MSIGSDKSSSFDVVIIGGGLVGASLALALADSGLRLALIEARTAGTGGGCDGWDRRIYAISPGSAAFLQRLGVWFAIDRARVQPVTEMRIWGDNSKAALDFSAYQSGLPELAFIVENRELEHAMGALLETQSNLRRLQPAACASIDWNDEAVEIVLQDGASLEAKLVVGADGGDSWVRGQAEIEVDSREYGQQGVVANFATAKPHGGVARQWFRDDGVLALLPLPGQRVSMVWSTGNDNARCLLGFSADELCVAVGKAAQQVLGELTMIGAARAFPLRLQRVQRLVKPRTALIGDAAHNMHPLAGQGVNLGFQDARELAAVLSNRGPQDDCGDYFLLRRYERARKEAILAMQLTTDALQKLFNTRGRALSRLRNAGLAVTNRLASVKRRLAQHALG